MTLRFALSTVAAVALMGVAACGDGRDDDVVQAPDAMTATEQTAEPVLDGVGEHVTALGMNREELEDADLLSAERTDLGDVEAIIVDADNNVIGFAIDLERSDREVVIPLDQVTSIEIDGDKNLQTALTVEQMNALPDWDRETMRSPAPSTAGTSGTGL
jgi:hypothetical protein